MTISSVIPWKRPLAWSLTNFVSGLWRFMSPPDPRFRLSDFWPTLPWPCTIRQPRVAPRTLRRGARGAGEQGAPEARTSEGQGLRADRKTGERARGQEGHGGRGAALGWAPAPRGFGEAA